ncbi:radical SAM family protein [Tautonia sociabilis]|uniref:Radical SAM protein n=1 Tax=Tautonia sociabilis TaxID=2080755 RepID=A0A432MQD1_9BACT|nr:hypothetical protein [Tautonia sociabilis]RUL89703.1 hypothetical protein TsocGM_00630 [Tautonia sociabilis]
MRVEATTVRSILTRASGYLDGIASHSLQPYRGCPFGTSLCGVGCYVRHARHLMGGRVWGTFLDARVNAAEAYREQVDRERRWARRSRGRFGIFLSSATEPFPPQEDRLGITRSVLGALRDEPPDLLIVQTHSHRVSAEAPLLVDLAGRCELRVHLSIETDRDRLPGLPGHASPISRRFEAAALLKRSGLHVVVTVAPLLPIADPDGFFSRVAEAADAVVLDHFIGGDGSPAGSRTLQTGLPAAMAQIDPDSLTIEYRDRMAEVAERHLPGRVGIGRDGFAGRWLGGAGERPPGFDLRKGGGTIGGGNVARCRPIG